MSLPTSSTSGTPGDPVRTLQILSASLVAGVLIFGLIVVTVLRRDPRGVGWDLATPMPLSLVALGFALVAIALSVVVPRTIVRGGLRQHAAERRSAVSGPGGVGPATGEASLLALLTTAHLVKLALLEGAAFLNLVAFMVEGRGATLVAAAVLVLVMIGHFPSRPRVELQLDDARARLATIRAESGG